MTTSVELHEYIRQLRTLGPEMAIPIAAHVVEAGDAAVAPLAALAIDIDLLVGPAPLCYAPIHALRLLGELDSSAAIAALITAPVPSAPDRETEQRTTIWDGEVPQIIARNGVGALDTILGLLDDDSTSNIGHHRAALALAYLSYAHPDAVGQIVAALEARLTTSNPDRNASVALALANMGSESSYTAVFKAYQAGDIAKDAVQMGPMRKLLLSRSNARLGCVNHPLGERYAHHPLRPQPGQR
ncbi:MAG: hypothetical protein RLZZ297_1336 [Chloroflexota bacterium]|jgi:hypothetical protein